MQLVELTKEIFHVIFPTQLDITSTFLRFQEHFENPKFKGKRTGKFTYYEDWSGFNFPSHVLDAFYEGRFDPLSGQESGFLDLFRGKQGDQFYIIGTSSDSETPEDDFRHECGHALYYLNEGYRIKAAGILLRIPEEIRARINKYLHESNYCSDVWMDETHAHLLADLGELKDDGIDLEPLMPFHHALNELFDGYIPQK
ncbi:MAG: hypothetical protein KAT43_02170 [Nanoarchaeota archaeon]|nr:hypothetical protein [Nanoarchaeota archaeon]